MQIHMDRTDTPSGIQSYGWHYGYMWLIVSQNSSRHVNIAGVCIPQGHKWHGWNSVAIVQYRGTPSWWPAHNLRPIGASWRGTAFGYFGNIAEPPSDGMYWLFAAREPSYSQISSFLGGYYCTKNDAMAMCELLYEVK